MASSGSPCLRDANSARPPGMMNKVQSGEWSIAKDSQSEKPQRYTQRISPAVTIPVMDKEIIYNMTASDQVTSKLDSHFQFLSAQQATTDNLSKQREESKMNFASSSTKKFVADGLNPENCMEKERTENVNWPMDKRPFSVRDKRVSLELVLPSTAVSIEERCVYISKVELGPLCPRGSHISNLPSTLQPEAQIKGTIQVPNMIKLLTSCPQYSKIHGMPTLHQSQVIAWPDDRRLLFQKLPSNRFPLLLDSGYANSFYEGSEEMAKMLHLTLSCSGSASHNCQWRKPLQIKEELVSHMSFVQEQAVSDTNIVKITVAMLPTCSRKASVPGFPSAPLQKTSNTPNMASLLPTCPKQTMILGMPDRQRVMAHNIKWHILREFILDRPLRSNPTLVQEKSHEDKELAKHMVDMLPCCSWAATMPSFPSTSQKEPSVPGVPFAPSQDPSMADFLPTCPRKTKVIGLPCKEPVSDQGVDLDTTKHILMEKCLIIGKVLIQEISPVAFQDPDKREMFSSAAIMPSCLVRTCLVDMPTKPQILLPSIVSLVPVCPKQTQSPGMPSLVQNESKNRDWHALRHLMNKRAKTPRQACIVQCIQKDTEIPKDMVGMLISCPQKAKVFGLPSAPQKEPSMVNVMPSCPIHSGVPGLPSKTRQKLCLSMNEWFGSKGLQWESPFIKREVQILNAVSCFDKNTAESMSTILPSCPENARVPGFPSALTLTLADGPTMVNSLSSCTKESRIPGMPLTDTNKQLEWLMEIKSLLLPREKSTATLHLQDDDVFYLDCEMIGNMASILTTCPGTACLPGFPSVACQILEDIPSMISMLPTCPRHSRVCGIPSRFHSESDKAEWSIDERLVWERPFTKPGRKSLIHDHKMYFREKAVIRIMVSMLPPCPKHSYIPGIPSKVGEKQVEEPPSMLKSLGTFPKHGKILGLPAKNSAKEYDGWCFYRDAVWENLFNRRHGVVYQSFTVKEMSYRDKEIMLSMLPSCPRQALNPGFPSAPQPQVVDATDEGNLDMVQLLPCCPRQSNIIGFPSSLSVFSDSEVQGWPLMIIKTQDHCPFYKSYGSPHRDIAILSLEPSCPNIHLCSGFIAVPPPDLNQLPNMVNIVPSCPKKSSVLGVPSTHVYHSRQGWPDETLQLVESGTTPIGEKRENLMSQELSLEEHSFCKDSTNERSMRFILPSQDVQEDVQQRMTIESSTCTIEAIVKDLPSSNSEVQVDQPSPRFTGTEMLWDDASPTRLDFGTKKLKSDACSPLKMKKDEQDFLIPIEAEEIAVLEEG